MMRPNGHRPRHIAPRLASGDSRLPIAHGLPEEIKDGLRRIAAREHQSVSWVLEQVIIEFFHLRTPKYVTPKTPPREEGGDPRS